MSTTVLILGGIFILFILFAIIKRVIKAILGIVIIAALILGGLYLYNAYPNELKNVTNTIGQVVNSTTVKDYLRVDENGKYYVYEEAKNANGDIIYPKGRIFDYPGVDISIDKIIDIASGDYKNFKKQYYKIDKKGNPIVPEGVTPPRKFVQPKL